MIIIPIVVFAVYALCNTKRTVKEACVKEVTVKSADATTRAIIMIVVGVVLLAIVTGGANL